MTDRVGFRIAGVEFNDVNGGSFSVTASKALGDNTVIPSVQKILHDENKKELDTLNPYVLFSERVIESRHNLLEFIRAAQASGKKVAALGASTKGNVLLQYCGLTDNEISFVGEVNHEKFGCYTPGTWIPIIPESQVLEKEPDYLIVLPWHFRKFFEANRKLAGMALVFPLPVVEVVIVGG